VRLASITTRRRRASFPWSAWIAPLRARLAASIGNLLLTHRITSDAAWKSEADCVGLMTCNATDHNDLIIDSLRCAPTNGRGYCNHRGVEPGPPVSVQHFTAPILQQELSRKTPILSMTRRIDGGVGVKR
jgi:hypothetical protein